MKKIFLFSFQVISIVVFILVLLFLVFVEFLRLQFEKLVIKRFYPNFYNKLQKKRLEREEILEKKFDEKCRNRGWAYQPNIFSN